MGKQKVTVLGILTILTLCIILPYLNGCADKVRESYKKGQLLESEHNYKEALAQYQIITDNYSDNKLYSQAVERSQYCTSQISSEALCNEGKSLLDSGDTKAALLIFNRIKEYYPDSYVLPSVEENINTCQRNIIIQKESKNVVRYAGNNYSDAKINFVDGKLTIGSEGGAFLSANDGQLAMEFFAYSSLLSETTKGIFMKFKSVESIEQYYYSHDIERDNYGNKLSESDNVLVSATISREQAEKLNWQYFIDLGSISAYNGANWPGFINAAKKALE